MKRNGESERESSFQGVNNFEKDCSNAVITQLKLLTYKANEKDII